MSGMENEKRAPVPDPIERVSETTLVMARTFIGSLSAASAGREVIRTKISALIGQGSATPVLTVPLR